MKKIRMVLIGMMVMGVGSVVWGQSPHLTDAEISALKTLAEYNKTWNVFLNVWAILGPILGAVSTYFAIKSRIQKWAEEEITKKASEKVGVDWLIVKDLVNERALLLKKRSTVFIAVVNHSTGERTALESILTGLHYPKPKFFTFKKVKDGSIRHFESDFKKSDFSFLIIDNEDGKMSEEEINEIIEKNQEAFGSKMIWFTKDDIKSFPSVTKRGIAVVKQPSRFQIELDDRLPGA